MCKTPANPGRARKAGVYLEGRSEERTNGGGDMDERESASDTNRRSFVRNVAVGAGALLTGCATARRGHGAEHGGSEEAEVTPGEDLMQEHGVLDRVLLIYEEAAARLTDRSPLDLTVVTESATVVRQFIEDYHERSEEQYVFPRLEAAGRERELVALLRTQHERGRQLTGQIVQLAAGSDHGALATALRAFVRMVRPHAAREETVIVPAFREVVGRRGYHELGEQFEEEEHKRFGEQGFARIVGEVARLEAALGLDDLSRFTAA